MDDHSYTTEEVARLLKVSKLTVYDLIKKEKLPAFRVGKQMRIDARDLELFKSRTKRGETREATPPPPGESQSAPLSSTADNSIIISGQDMSLDILAKYLEGREEKFRPLRSYVGSLNSLFSLFKEECDIVSVHLYDGESGEYNIPYVKRVLTGHDYLVVNLIRRQAGLYVPGGNPKNIQSWDDLKKPGLRLINREKGAGARVLLDEQLRLLGVKGRDLTGYDQEETSHLGVAGAVRSNRADVGVGIEKAAKIVGTGFIPLIQERYDLVLLKKPENQPLIAQTLAILQSETFQREIQSIGDYDLTLTGQVMYET
ncbi:helix-turn-helix transcriptional regulator [Halalkalibacter oceani]|uniref:Helix-turn-helix transcriptional regulator n=1 Tax=Halalkalibacter oceani TaxID=1653776 RepID=A0A9X2INM8_9BACI|nr:helix-turn-helix transcriptional regulator [Halalkalibacter oceani]MCM3712748.1 helix-turn-helix transcriptional regulator [Halalkalibacter oceani]